MKFNMVILAAAAAGSVSAAPKRRFDMEGMLREMAPLARRQAANTTVEMIGDLKTQGATTASGTTVKNCLEGTGSCQDTSAKVLQYSCCVDNGLTRLDIHSSRGTRQRGL